MPDVRKEFAKIRHNVHKQILHDKNISDCVKMS